MKVTLASGWIIVALLWPAAMYTISSLWPGPGLPPEPAVQPVPSQMAPPTPTAGSRVYVSSSSSAMQFWSDPQSGEVHLTLVLPEDGSPVETAPAETTP